MGLIRMLISTTTASRTTTSKLFMLVAAGNIPRLVASAPEHSWKDFLNMKSSIAMDVGVSKIKLNN
jgi:hypothetical protein